MISDYENVNLEVLRTIYDAKYTRLSALKKEQSFPAEPPQDKSELIKKLNQMDAILPKLSGNQSNNLNPANIHLPQYLFFF